MKLKSLNLATFRGFEQVNIDFEEDITLLAGINGVGKSAILKAIATLVSHSIPQFTASSEKPILLFDTDVQYGKPGLSASAVLQLRDAEVRADISRTAPIDQGKAKELLRRRDKLRIAMRGTSKDSQEERDFQDKLDMIELQLADVKDLATVRVLPISLDLESYILQEKASGTQPIAVLYSTTRFLSRLPPKLSPTKNIYLKTAYTNALTQLEVSLYEFANWFRALSEGAIQTPDLAPKLFDQIQYALSVFLPKMSDLQLHTEGRPRFSLLKGESRFYLEQLSDGERGLLALVLDLIRRLAIANPLSENPVAEGAALVLIDEVELHLHPKWQRQVIRRLLEVFKNCQFVITTHSPQVIGQVKAEKLRLLHFDEKNRVVNSPVAQAFGMDSGWILQNIMGGTARDYETEQKLASIYDAIDESELAVAREKSDELRNEVGDFPDLQEALALLDRLVLLGQDEKN